MIKKFMQRRQITTQNKAEAILLKAQQLLQSRMYNQCIVTLDQAMEADSITVLPRLRGWFGDLRANCPDAEAVLTVGNFLLKSHPRNFELTSQMANLARDLGKTKMAIDLNRSVLQSQPNHETALYNLAALCAGVPVYDGDAKLIFEQMSQLEGFIYPEYRNEPDPVEHLKETVHLYWEANLREELLYLNEALDRANASKDIAQVDALTIAIISKTDEQPDWNSGEFLRAFDQKIRSLQGHSKQTWIFDKAIYAMSTGHIEEAHAALESFTEHPKDKNYDLAKSILAYLSGDLDRCIEGLKTLLSADENDRRTLINLGLVYQREHRSLPAAKYLIKGGYLLKRSRGEYTRWRFVEQAIQSLHENQPKQALADLLVAVDERPDTGLWWNIADCYLHLKRPGEAITALKECMKRNPSHSQAALKLESLHDSHRAAGAEAFAAKRWFKSTEEYQFAISALDRSETLFEAAQAYERAGRPESSSLLRKQAEQLERTEKQTKLEHNRSQLLETAEKQYKAGELNHVIEGLEKVLEMKADPKIFQRLVELLKMAGRTADLVPLQTRWEQLLEQTERYRVYQADLSTGREKV